VLYTAILTHAVIQTMDEYKIGSTVTKLKHKTKSLIPFLGLCNI